MDSSHPTGPALVAAAADADPVTLLVLGWLAASRSENTRTAYARDIGISPPRRPSRAPSWLTWCQEQGVHPVTGATGLHVARYARQLETAGLSPASAARKLAAVSSWYAWLARRGHIPASPATAITRPRTAPAAPPVPGLTQAQALKLLHTADQAPGHQRARTAALVALPLVAVRIAERPSVRDRVTATVLDAAMRHVGHTRSGGAYYRLAPRGWFLWERLDGERTMRALARDYLAAFRDAGPDAVAEVIAGLAGAGFVEGIALRADAGPLRRVRRLLG